jgi:hypothetical protein
MPGLPGLPGIAAFAGLKFGGYVLAGLALKRLQPALQTSALKIAGIRTGLGILLGPAFVYGSLFLVAHLFPDPNLPDFLPYLTYFVLAGVRVLVWALVLYIASRGFPLKRSKLWLYSLGGAAWSCFLDVPGIALAWVAPGKVPFC